MIIPFDNSGSIGVVKDKASFELPPEAWSSATNIRFNDDYAQKFEGHSIYLTPAIAPQFLLSLPLAASHYWIYPSTTKIYATDGGLEFDLTRTASDYTGAIDDKWTGTVLGGIPILCNGIDDPQMLSPVDMGGNFSDLSNWPANTTCKVIKDFRNHLIALDVTKSSTRYPYLVKWSHPAVAGSVPSTWDETDATKDAGEIELGESGGLLVDGGTLGDTFILYRETSIHELRYIGGNSIFSQRKLFDDIGLFAKRCFVEIEGKHCVLTNDDVIVHDGRTPISIVDKAHRDTLFSILSAADEPDRAFLSANYAKNEVWICYPKTTDSYCTEALVWNYRHNTFGFRTLPGASDIAFGNVSDGESGIWDTDTRLWSAATEVWGKTTYNTHTRGMIMADASNTQIFKIDDTDQFNGVSFTASLERQGLAVIGQDKRGQFKVDLNSIKQVTRVIPKFDAAAGTVITVYVGYQMETGDSVTWDSGTSYTVGTDYKVDTRVSGRLIAVKFETTGNVAWKLTGFDLDINVVGQR